MNLSWDDDDAPEHLSNWVGFDNFTKLECDKAQG